MFTQDYSTPTFPKVEEKVDPVVETLRNGAATIRRVGLARGCAVDVHGANCTVAAMSDVGVPYKLVCAALDVLAKFVGIGDYGHVVSWSDAHTQAEVIAALEGAADSRARALAGRK